MVRARQPVVVLTLLAAAGFVVPAGAATPLAAAASAKTVKTVTLQANDFRFCAASARACLPTDTATKTVVSAGTRVTWRYTDTECDLVAVCPGHDVVFAKGGGTTKLVKTDGARIFSMLFRRAGTYSYFCSFHQQFGMTGTIVVTKH